MSTCNHPEDRELAHQALAGHRLARDRIVERMLCISRFLAVRNRRAGHPLDSEDLADASQEAAIAVWKGLRRYRGSAALETWVYVVCSGVFARAVRRVAAERRTREAAHSIAASEESFDPQIREHDQLHACIDELPPETREVVLARTFEDEDFRTMARRTGTAMEALRARYYRAVRRLRDCLTRFARREP